MTISIKMISGAAKLIIEDHDFSEEKIKNFGLLVLGPKWAFPEFFWM